MPLYFKEKNDKLVDYENFIHKCKAAGLNVRPTINHLEVFNYGPDSDDVVESKFNSIGFVKTNESFSK